MMAPGRQTNDDQPNGVGALEGKTVLVVEDEFIIAMEYVLHLEEHGAQVAGPVTSVAQALDAVRQLRIDAAVLDIDLQGTKSFAVADALMERGVAFVFATGYDDAVIPERFGRVLRCGKPSNPAAIVEAVLRALSGN
jgi:CheY-like chemotaxis protein